MATRVREALLSPPSLARHPINRPPPLRGSGPVTANKKASVAAAAPSLRISFQNMQAASASEEAESALPLAS